MSGAAAKIFDPLLRVARARSRRIPVFLSVILSERSESKRFSLCHPERAQRVEGPL